MVELMKRCPRPLKAYTVRSHRIHQRDWHKVLRWLLRNKITLLITSICFTTLLIISTQNDTVYLYSPILEPGAIFDYSDLKNLPPGLRETLRQRENDEKKVEEELEENRSKDYFPSDQDEDPKQTLMSTDIHNLKINMPTPETRFSGSKFDSEFRKVQRKNDPLIDDDGNVVTFDQEFSRKYFHGRRTRLPQNLRMHNGFKEIEGFVKENALQKGEELIKERSLHDIKNYGDNKEYEGADISGENTNFGTNKEPNNVLRINSLKNPLSTSVLRSKREEKSTEKNSTCLPPCPAQPPGLRGREVVGLMSSPQQAEEVARGSGVQEGGRWAPSHCWARYTVAIVVPVRDRRDQEWAFLSHMHPFLQRQELNYTIFIVEQAGSALFNRAKLLNVGFVEAMKAARFDCIVFHDVDMLPEDDRHLYHCAEQPRHMVVASSNNKYRHLNGFLGYR
ncbi:uncharacterized protein LOC108682369 [Hyalella azteca]|uniref:Beta-1,4-N-acetylgalactosaminyltransferase n=1 Tax=Hyalella azteca TaxID=294128 RepID=A0A8B7PNK7_HYAAZ|nr:uncharacterized protein LOC108682369 [Hyalella azteca]